MIEDEIIVIVEPDPIRVILDAEPEVKINEVVIPGPPGPPGETIVPLRMDLPKVTQVLTLGTLAAGMIIDEARVKVIIPFNDPMATVSIGTDDDPEYFMARSGNKLQGTGVYIAVLDIGLIKETTIKVFMSAIATVGAGLVEIKYIKEGV